MNKPVLLTKIRKMSEYTHSIETEIKSLAKLGTLIQSYLLNENIISDKHKKIFDGAIANSYKGNAYFTKDSVGCMLESICEWLTEENLNQWIKPYMQMNRKNNSPKKIGVVMAGNIPLVGFHDFLCVMLSGNIFYGKLSHQDAYLLPAIAEILFEIDSQYKERIFITKDIISGYEAIIATGSNNSARYFEYYFKDVPSIIRKNRNSVAVLTGNETQEQLEALMDDLFLYYGLGCRNISKLFVPNDYDFSKLLSCGQRFLGYLDHHKYRNNYDYYKTISLMNGISIFDGGFYSLKEDNSLHTPVSVIHYEYYNSLENVKKSLTEIAENIQCIIAEEGLIQNAILFGKSQKPSVNEYADNIDTMQFLFGLSI